MGGFFFNSLNDLTRLVSFQNLINVLLRPELEIVIYFVTARFDCPLKNSAVENSDTNTNDKYYGDSFVVHSSSFATINHH